MNTKDAEYTCKNNFKCHEQKYQTKFTPKNAYPSRKTKIKFKS